MNTSLLTDLRDDLAGRLGSDAALATVVIHAEQPGVTVATIEKALESGGLGEDSLTGKLAGACLLVEMPRLGAGSRDVPGPEGDVTVAIQAFTRDHYNDADAGGTGIPCEALVLIALNVIHHYRPKGVAGARGPWMATEGAEFQGVSDNGIQSWRARFTIPATIGRSAQVATPVVTVGESTITATCATSGATIYYTTDGSYPGSGNLAATEYTGAIALPASPYLLRFGAEDEDGDLIGSQTEAVDG